MRTRKPGLGVFGGAPPPTFDTYERASVIGQAAGPRAITQEQAVRAGLHGATNLPRLEHRDRQLTSKRLPGWNFHIPLSTSDGVVTAKALAGGPEQPGTEELRALAALLRLPEEERFTAERLTELATMLKIDVACFLGIAKALAEVPPEARAPALQRAEALLNERARLELEDTCARLFLEIALPQATCPVTLLLFSYQPGHVAYKTALDRAALGQALHELVEGWRTGKPREIRTDRPPNLPTAEQAQRILDAVRAALPDDVGIGCALLFGVPPATLYIANADREGMTQVLGDLAENIALDDAIDIVGRARRVVKDWHCPPGEAKTAQAFELFAMNAAHAYGVLGWRPGMDQDATSSWEERAVLAAGKNPAFDAIFRRVATFLGGFPGNGFELERGFHAEVYALMTGFLHTWRQASYARLEVGHKLAAALCLTDVPDDLEVRAPWPAWSLVLPDGLFGDVDVKALANGERAARVWCLGTDDAYVVTSRGAFFVRDPEEERDAIGVSLRNLIRGACLALSNPEASRKPGGRSQASKASSRRHGPPELEQARYLLAAPVKIDLREHLRGVLEGRKGASPTVQFLVRGHWRQQAYGPQHSLRRATWIEPFWKGPEEARVLLRQHKVEE